MILKWSLNSTQLKYLNELRDDLVLDTLQSLSILVEYDDMPVAEMFTEQFKKGHTILQKHVLKVYQKRYKKLHKEAKKFRGQLSETPPPQSQENKEPSKVITSDLMQIDDTSQTKALKEPNSWDLDLTGKRR